jgi:L-seryl-tRNA(Ser) seleniumtransferase
VRKNPFARIVRVGKLTLAAMEATLRLFLDETVARAEVPALRMMARERADIEQEARRIAEVVRAGANDATVEVVEGTSEAGSGSLPGHGIPTVLVAVAAPRAEATELARRLRRRQPPVFTRVPQGRVLVDPRTLLAGEAELVMEALIDVLASRGPSGGGH